MNSDKNLKIDWLKEKISKINAIRFENTGRFPITNTLLILLFPVFIVCMAEINQSKYPSKFILFLADKPLVMLFNVFIASLLFYALFMIVRKGWIAVTAIGTLYFGLSIIELFKFGTNGNHLIFTDISLVKSIKSISSFAYIKITPMFVIYTIIVILYLLAVFWFNPKLKIKLSRRLPAASLCIISCVCIVIVPSVSMPVYSFFDIDTTESTNSFKLNEKFDNNSFLAFFVQTASESFSNILTEPENYTELSVDECLEPFSSSDSNADDDDFVKPNVIVIMSESFADFRVFEQLSLDTSAYDGFDNVAAQSFKGTAVVPTFAAFTVRTEFELNFGLPVKSLNDPNMPQRFLEEHQQPTIAHEYKKLGYSTAYVHPFLGAFYDRDEKYSYFDFDQMIFQDDFTVDIDYYSSYISDEVVFNQLEQLIVDSDEPMFIHTTTMQNHQPYNHGENPEDELNNYLAGIKYSSDSLETFINDLNALDEPTVVFFMGDHFPSLNGEDSVYAALGINGDNCSVVYEQPYIIWNNYGLDYSTLPQDKISTFYLPYIIMDFIGAPMSEFSSYMFNKMQELPVYSTDYDETIPNDEQLDMLTYDRILGEIISDEELRVDEGD